MNTGELIAGLVVYTVGCVIQGVLGFGAGLFAVPILALINPQFVPGPLLMVNPLLTGLFAWRERGAVDSNSLKWALGGRIPGVLLGTVALTVVSEDHLGALFGTLLLVAIGLKATGFQTKRTASTLLGAGALSGFMGTSVAVGGPPIALVLNDASGPEFRSTLSVFFFIGTGFSVVALSVAGQFGIDDLILSFWLILSVVAGFILSGPLRRILDRRWLAPAVYVMSTVAAVALLVRSAA